MRTLPRDPHRLGRVGHSPALATGPIDEPETTVEDSLDTGEPRPLRLGLSTTTLNDATARSADSHRSADCDQPDGRIHLGGSTEVVLSGIGTNGSLVCEPAHLGPPSQAAGVSPLAGQLSGSPKAQASCVDLGDTAVARVQMDRQEFRCRNC
jgi:hypothetical protein